MGCDQYLLDEWLGVPSLQVWSGRDVPPLPEDESEDDPSERDGFSYHADGTNKRCVEYSRNIHDGTEFTTRGKPHPFETLEHYKARRSRDRMTRAILFELLAKFEIDAVSVFGRRELDNPLFYTAEIPGQSCSIYEADRIRYNEIINRPPLST